MALFSCQPRFFKERCRNVSQRARPKSTIHPSTLGIRYPRLIHICVPMRRYAGPAHVSWHLKLACSTVIESAGSI